jgi:hypothetical protein
MNLVTQVTSKQQGGNTGTRSTTNVVSHLRTSQNAQTNIPTYNTTPANDDQVAFRDLLLFEDRLRHTLDKRQREQRLWEGLLFGFVGTMIYSSYHITWGDMHNRKQSATADFVAWSWWRHLSLLLFSIVSLTWIFTTSIWRDKIVQPRKFVPQINRVLRSFNMQFNRPDHPSELAFLRRVPRRFQEGFTEARKQKKMLENPPETDVESAKQD